MTELRMGPCRASVQFKIQHSQFKIQGILQVQPLLKVGHAAARYHQFIGKGRNGFNAQAAVEPWRNLCDGAVADDGVAVDAEKIIRTQHAFEAFERVGNRVVFLVEGAEGDVAIFEYETGNVLGGHRKPMLTSFNQKALYVGSGRKGWHTVFRLDSIAN